MAQLIDLGKLRFYWTGEWSATTQYEINDVVKYGGNVYVYTYTLADTGILPTDSTHWALMIQGIRFQGQYSSTAAYRTGDGIAYGGTVYLALKDNTNITPTDATNGAANWTKFLDGIQYEGLFSATTAYQKSDLVIYGANAYIAKIDSTGNLPTNTTYFDRLVSGVAVQGAWNSSTVYLPGQVVAYGAKLAQAVIPSTAGTPPLTASGNFNAGWQLFVDSIRDRGVWGGATTYYVNDVVTRGGSSYICTYQHVSTSATPPPADIAAGNGNWRKYNSGVRWRGTLAASTAYLVDDLVTDGVSTFLVTADFTSTASIVAADYAANLTLMSKGGDPLPAQTGNAGKFLSTNGTSPSWAAVTDTWKTVSTTYTATASDALWVNTSGGSFTITLPAAPTAGQRIKFLDLANVFATRPLTIARNSSVINGVADDLVANTNNVAFDLLYTGATYGWKVI